MESGNFSGYNASSIENELSNQTPSSTNISSSAAGSMSVDMYANTYLADHPTLLLLFTILLSVASVCGVLGNIMVVHAVVTDRILRQPANLLVINVAIADVFIAGVINPFNVIGAVYGYQMFVNRHWLCLLIGSLCVPVCTSSLYNLALIAVSRYVHICKFNFYASVYTWNKTFLMCISVWIFGLLLHLPNHIGWGHTDYGALFFICTADVGIYSYSILWLTVGMFLPFAVVAISYCLIFVAIQWRSHQIQQTGKASLASKLTQLFPSTANSTTNDIVMVQRRAPENFVVRDAIISDNNLDTMNTYPYRRRSYSSSHCDYGTYGNHHPNPAAAANKKAAKQNKSRTIVLAYIKPNRTFKSVQNEIKLIRTLFITVVAFVAGWSLFIVLVLMRTPDWMPKWVYVLSIFLAHIQSAVNPIIYCTTNVHFRNAFKMKIFSSGT